ncbi:MULTISPECIES: hypothetical protein [Streptomyces]|uniref:hypothetical protein n=1 Tax=Streptomyces TaxID=1883 RepID=UPI00142EA925|nr:hypothetical protein [Streptomyces bauhiniae]
MRNRCTLPLTAEALRAHGLTSRDQAHEQGRCTQILARQHTPTAPARDAAPRAEETRTR